MNIELIERDLDALLVEFLLDRFDNVEVYGPVVSGFGPYSYCEYDRACAVFGKHDSRCGILEHK